MRIGILTAMTEELLLLQSHLKSTQKKTIGGRDYLTGHLFDNEDIHVTMVFSRWGKVASASATATLIHEFKIDYLIFTGVAASVNPDVHVGDIVIAERLYQHDMDASPFCAKYEIPLTQKKFFMANAHLSKISKTASQEYLVELMKKNNESDEIQQKIKEFNIHSPSVHTGIIATGDKFIRSQQQIDDILDQLGVDAPHVLAVEMEGAAVAQVCEEHHVPFCIIRTISDCADKNAPIDFTDFINSVARHYSYEVVKKIWGNGLVP